MNWSIADIDYLDIELLHLVIDEVLNLMKQERLAIKKNSTIKRFNR